MKKTSSPTRIDVNQQLLTFYQQGHYPEAERLAQSLTAQSPNNGFAWKVLGASLTAQGLYPRALPALEKAARLLPTDAGAQSNLGAAFRRLGRLAEAEASHRRALSINPDFAEACNNLGSTLRDLGRLDEAAHFYRQALRLKADFVSADFNLAITLKELGQLEAARASCGRVLERAPGHVEALGLRAEIDRRLGYLEEAVSGYRRLLALRSDNSDAHNSLGCLLMTLGQTEEAAASLRRALAIDPGSVAAFTNLGGMLTKLGNLEEAAACCRQALQIRPDSAEACHQLGNIELVQRNLAAAELCYRKALQSRPEFVEAHVNLAATLRDLCRLEEAAASYGKAAEIRPDNLNYAISRSTLLPAIQASTESAAFWYDRYAVGLASLLTLPGQVQLADCNPMSFYLAYHNRNDLPVMAELHRFFRERAPELSVTAPHILAWSAAAVARRRLRIGFISRFLKQHSIGKLYQGLITQLDRRRFEVVLLHAPESEQDALSQNLNALAEKSLALSGNLAEQQAAIAAEQLDVLFYPDIGMDPPSYFLAFARLAPVQVVSWGHPDTTGLPTVDYFLSAATIEPDAADAHYSERLVCLHRLPSYYQPLLAPAQIPSRVALGLPEAGTLYGCPQNLFKFHPEFDAVLAAIAEGDPAGHIVLLEGRYRAWTDLLQARWAKTYPVLLERVLFLPRRPLDSFMALMAHMDVVLDPIHFGSGNTLYEAMVYGTPIVTWPGRFMRGRIVAGAYRQMGIEDAPIVSSLAAYAPLALALGRDPARRTALRQASLAAAGRELFADWRAVREFAAFLEAAVEAAGRGMKLPQGWRPPIEEELNKQGIL